MSKDGFKYVVVKQKRQEENVVSFVPYTWKNRKLIKRDVNRIYDKALTVEYVIKGDNVMKCEKDVEDFKNLDNGAIVKLNDELVEYLKDKCN